MSEIQVRAGVPVASRHRNGGGGGRKAKYPFAQMSVGDSFFVPSETPAKAAKSMYSTARHFATKHEGFKFAVRTLADAAQYDQPGVAGVQVARVAAQ